MLEKLGFVWNSHDLLWEERLNDLKVYKEIHGDCNVPSKYTPNPSLAIWVKVRTLSHRQVQHIGAITNSLSIISSFSTFTAPAKAVQIPDRREGVDNDPHEDQEVE